MTESQPLPRPSTTQRRVAWFVIACAAASLALVIAATVAGGHVRWTSWALPLLVAANAATFFFGALNRWPRLVRAYWFLSIGVAAAVIVVETLALLHR